MVTKYQAERSYEQAIAIAIRRRNPGLPPTVAADRAKALATRRAVRFVPMRGLVVDDLAAVQAIAPELSTAPRPLAEEWERREAMGAALNGAGDLAARLPGARAVARHRRRRADDGGRVHRPRGATGGSVMGALDAIRDAQAKLGELRAKRDDLAGKLGALDVHGAEQAVAKALAAFRAAAGAEALGEAPAGAQTKARKALDHARDDLEAKRAGADAVRARVDALDAEIAKASGILDAHVREHAGNLADEAEKRARDALAAAFREHAAWLLLAEYAQGSRVTGVRCAGESGDPSSVAGMMRAAGLNHETWGIGNNVIALDARDVIDFDPAQPLRVQRR